MPEDFGKWVTFSLKVLWVSDENGWVTASCDGKIIYATEGEPSNQSPHCWESNQCEPLKEKNPKTFNFILGPNLSGWGGDWKNYGKHTSQFVDIQPDGIGMDMRNSSVTRGVKNYSVQQTAMLKSLQTRLAELGCKPGNTEGAPDKATREVALSCRKFKDGSLPESLNLLTLPLFVKVYADPGATTLSAGGGKQDIAKQDTKPKIYVKLAETGAFKSGRDTSVNSNFFAKFKNAKNEQIELDFIVVGGFDYAENNFTALSFILQDNLDKQEVSESSKCGYSITTYPDETKHVELQMRKDGVNFSAPPNTDCLIKALGKRPGRQVPYLVTDFGTLAKSIVSDGSWKKLRHEGLKAFFKRVADGEITVGG